MDIKGFELGEKIYESRRSLVYRGLERASGKNVIIKLHPNPRPTPEETAEFQREYDIVRKLSGTNSVEAYSLEQGENYQAIVFEDLGGVSLKTVLENGSVSLMDGLSLSLDMVSALDGVHKNNVIHRDVNPANFIINQETQQLKIIDFGISSESAREAATAAGVNGLEGTLAYISPEQTGRVNYPQDYRTDYYSLGVTLYRLFAEQLPFENSDAMEIVHSHIAREPAAPVELNPRVPNSLSAIILKLIRKSPEDRYQTLRGLEADLSRCLRELKEQGKIGDFEPGLEDISEAFEIPHRLYGRKEETEILLSAFERSAQGPAELLLVAGYSGIGKTSLIRELYRPVTGSKGYFVAGKFEQFKKDIPYSALIQAFSSLCAQLLSEPEEAIASWQKKLSKTLGDNGRVITDVIPEIQHIIGEQPEAAVLGPVETQNRFKTVFREFIRVFASVDHPLVLFLDDLQWADLASLELVKAVLAEPDTRNLLFIGSYRDNEVSSTHPLRSMEEELLQAGCRIENIHLGPLAHESVRELASAALRREAESCEEIAKLLESKTGGNPFFLNEFLKSLHEEGLIKLEPGTGWVWDMDAVRNLQVTDNVVELMADKIQKLEEAPRELLKVAAAVGNRVDLSTMSIVAEKSPEELRASLRTLLAEGFLLKVKDQYHFVHDRIQEAAYSLIKDSRKPGLHLKIGRLFLKRIPTDELDQKIFFVTHHINEGVSLLKTDEERLELCRLNYRAGSRAKSSSAYDPAFLYYGKCLGLLPESAWKDDYDNALLYYQEAAETAYQNASYEKMDEWIEAALPFTHNELDSVRFHEVRILAFIAQNLPEDAVKYALIAMAKFGYKFKMNPSQATLILGILKLKRLLRKKTPDQIVEQGEMTDPRRRAFANLMNTTASAAYFAAPDLFVHLTLVQLESFVKHGNMRLTPPAYATYGIILCGELNEFEAGYEYGQVALRLMEKLNAREFEARIKLIVHHLLSTWTRPVSKSVPELRRVYDIGLHVGDFEFGGYAIITQTLHHFFAGGRLSEVYEKMLGAREALLKSDQIQSLELQDILLQITANLSGVADKSHILDGEHYKEAERFQVIIENKSATALGYFYSHKVYLACVLEEHDAALELARVGEKYLKGNVAQTNVPLLYFGWALSCLSAAFAGKNKRTNVKQAKKILKRFVGWAKSSPANFIQKEYLIRAELAALEGKTDEAMNMYDEAIKKAGLSSYHNDRAIAQERAGRFWLRQGRESIAEMYLSEAWRTYLYWGAQAKVERMEQEFPRLLKKAQNESIQSARLGDIESTISATASSQSTTAGMNQQLDLASVVKVSQTLSGEIVLEKLLMKMMTLVMENAGASRGFYILEKNGALFVEVEGNEIRGEEQVRLRNEPLESADYLAVSIVNYVARTSKTIVLADAEGDTQFGKDAYIVREKPRSVLCLPVLNRSRLVGVLYLENNQSSGIFTEDRLQVLNLLSTQIAISLDNATLYTSLEEKVRDRTAQLRTTLEEVQTLKKQQDGDYFLTSQLLEPLGRNHVVSGRVKVDFFLKQKKEFEFKHWQEEIGGDLCVAHTLQLKGRTHTVFLNADAMGKSIQGAGGVLVLGSVFRAYVERTARSNEMQNKSERRWLQECLEELRGIFESFDGRMMVSLVAGMVDNESGDLYFVNAEHPFSVLYRDGGARFLEKELVLYKLGNVLSREKIPVYQMKLRPGDVFICGSDGRDDLMINRGEGGARILNEDMSQFLKRVEESQGELDALYKGLMEQGEQTDDLSMVRIEYDGASRAPL